MKKLPRYLSLIMLGLMPWLVACSGGSSGGSNPKPPSSSSVSVSSQSSSSVSSQVSSETSSQTSSQTSSAANGVPQGDSLLPANYLSSMNVWNGDNNGPVASHSLVDVNHPDFNRAVRVNVTNPAGEFWNGQLQFPLQGSMQNSDIIFIRVWFRSIETRDESGAGFATLFVEDQGPEYKKFVQRDLNSTGDWDEYEIPFELSGKAASDQLILKIGFGAGAKPQVFEVGGLEVLNYQNRVALTDLPSTRETYVGRDANAPWRAAAAARIEEHRKGDFSLKVKNASGDPVVGAQVDIKFKRHHYHFGSVIVSSILMGNNADSQKYREKVLELFNQSGTENDLKWAPWIGEWGSSFNQTTTLNALQWLKDNDIYARGHVLVWPGLNNLPNAIKPYLPANNPAGANPLAKQMVLDHIDDITSATANLLDEWDVLNEPYDNHYLMDAFGNQVMVDWFNRARLNLPQHKLYINDYSILSAGGRDIAHQNHYKQTIQYLLDQNAALDGIGMQGHFGGTPTGIDRVYEILEEFHGLFPDLKIRVTEFDVNTSDEEMQADYTRDFLTILFSHPATVGVQKWGFWEGAHWLARGAMYTRDWREKPNAQAWKHQIYSVWWNDFAGNTDAGGVYEARGFYGTYEVTVKQGDKQVTEQFVLEPGGESEFVVTLPGVN
jgi:endo-1,4-beta-xylanase